MSKFKKLSDTSSNCVEIVKAYLKAKFGVDLSDEQLFTIYSEEQDIWHLIERIETPPSEIETKSLGIKASGTVYHVFYARLMGKLAPHVLPEVDRVELVGKLELEGWEDRLHSYNDVILEVYRNGK